MAEIKHTPGPWSVVPHSRHKHSVSGGMWTNFAKVVTRISGRSEDSAEGLANARLIGAAPELLSAAIEVMQALEEHGPSIVPHLLDTDMNAGQRLRDAIAKAGA